MRIRSFSSAIARISDSEPQTQRTLSGTSARFVSAYTTERTADKRAAAHAEKIAERNENDAYLVLIR